MTHPDRAGDGQDEVRLVACGRTADGRVLPLDDDSWEAGITATEKRALSLAVIFGEPCEEHNTLESAKAKLRAAFPTQKDSGDE